uniref:Uncharacterized protein n=1 Tax=Cucumis melo TaxID=3656 RepID=A0A9I9E2A7_CUCME
MKVGVVMEGLSLSFQGRWTKGKALWYLLTIMRNYKRINFQCRLLTRITSKKTA